MNHRLILGALLALMLGACGAKTIGSHVQTGQAYPAHVGDVQIYMEAQSPPPGYAEVAIVEARGNARAGMPGTMDRLREEVAMVGGNAVINVRVDQGGTLVSITGIAVRY